MYEGRRLIHNTNSYWWQDPDRHTVRVPTSKLGSSNPPMKCAECYDYNHGVMLGKCSVCGHLRLSMKSFESFKVVHCSQEDALLSFPEKDVPS